MIVYSRNAYIQHALHTRTTCTHTHTPHCCRHHWHGKTLVMLRTPGDRRRTGGLAADGSWVCGECGNQNFKARCVRARAHQASQASVAAAGRSAAWPAPQTFERLPESCGNDVRVFSEIVRAWGTHLLLAVRARAAGDDYLFRKACHAMKTSGESFWRSGDTLSESHPLVPFGRVVDIRAGCGVLLRRRPDVARRWKPPSAP